MYIARAACIALWADLATCLMCTNLSLLSHAFIIDRPFNGYLPSTPITLTAKSHC